MSFLYGDIMKYVLCDEGEEVNASRCTDFGFRFICYLTTGLLAFVVGCATPSMSRAVRCVDPDIEESEIVQNTELATAGSDYQGDFGYINQGYNSGAGANMGEPVPSGQGMCSVFDGTLRDAPQNFPHSSGVGGAGGQANTSP